MSLPLISIIMPAFNAEKYIKAAIKSVQAQTYPHWELLVVNDGSTDGTPKIVEALSKADNRIKLINQTNKKLAGARNTGLQLAQGEWVALLDADDLWHAEKLSKQLDVINEHADVGLIYTAGWVFNNNDLENLSPYPIHPGTLSGADMYKLLYQYNTTPVLSVLFKKRIVAKIGLQQEVVHCLEDWDYWLRMALAGVTFYGLDEPLFYYRRHAHNMSSSVINMHYAQAVIWLKNYQPEVLSRKAFKRAIISLYNSLFPLLIANNQRDKAKELIKLLKPVLPVHAKLYNALLRFSNRNTIVFFSLFNRLYVKVLNKAGYKKK